MSVISLLCVTAAVQVVGGGISFVVGAQVWGSSSFRGSSKVSTSLTSVSEFSAIFDNVRISGGKASTVTTSGAKLLLHKSPAICRRPQIYCFQVQIAIKRVLLHQAPM
jgi:hypothetical protein